MRTLSQWQVAVYTVVSVSFATAFMIGENGIRNL
jgi:hypothetical protein